MEVDDLVEPAADRLSEPLDLGRHDAIDAMGDELFEHRPGFGGFGRGVEVAEPPGVFCLHPAPRRRGCAWLVRRDGRGSTTWAVLGKVTVYTAA